MLAPGSTPGFHTNERFVELVLVVGEVEGDFTLRREDADTFGGEIDFGEVTPGGCAHARHVFGFEVHVIEKIA